MESIAMVNQMEQDVRTMFNKQSKCSNIVRNKTTHKQMITSYRRTINSMWHAQLSPQKQHHRKFDQLITKYMADSRIYNILNNMIRMRECNYPDCRNKALKRFKICSRCKSVFYCNKRHQKLD